MTQFVNNDVSSGAVIFAADHNTQGSLIANVLNGGIENENIKAGAAIQGSKLANSSVTASQVDFGGSGSGIWWEEIGRATLGTAGDALSVSGLPARSFLKIIVALRVTGGNIDTNMTFNSDTGSNYAFRFSANYAAETTSTSQTSIPLETSTENVQHFTEMYIQNYSSLEKVFRLMNIRGTTAGAGNNVQTLDLRGKWANTSAQLSGITLTNVGTGDYAIGSTIIVLGHD